MHPFSQPWIVPFSNASMTALAYVSSSCFVCFNVSRKCTGVVVVVCVGSRKEGVRI